MTDSTKAMSFRAEFKEWATSHGWDISEAFTSDGKPSFIDATTNALWGGWHGRACADFRAHLAPRDVSDEDVTIPGPPYTAQKVLELRNRLDDRLRDDKYAIALAVAMLDEFRELLLQADRQRGGGEVSDGDYEQFAQYFEKNYNGTVVFANPRWHAEKLWRSAKRALLARRGQGREGWKLVPVEPTAEMLSCIAFGKWPEDNDAGKELQRRRGCDVVFPKSEIEMAVGQYQRMLAAAPDADAEGK